MTCGEIADFLLAYLDGELPARRRRVFEEHLAECEQCVDYIESYKTTVELSRATAERDDEVQDVPEALVAAILAARATDRPPGKGR